MKKLSLILVMFLMAIVNANATALITEAQVNAVTIDTGQNEFSIVNRSGSGDVFNEEYSGYTSTDYSGYYIGTVTKINGKNANDNKLNIMGDLISYYLDETYEIQASDVDKINSPNSIGTDLTITYADDSRSGTWTTKDVTHLDPTDPWVKFYTVKASTEFSLYFVDPMQQVGIWSTKNNVNNGGNNPALSHIQTIYDEQAVPDMPEAPEAGTLVLFGVGLLALAKLKRNGLKIKR